MIRRDDAFIVDVNEAGSPLRSDTATSSAWATLAAMTAIATMQPLPYLSRPDLFRITELRGGGRPWR